MLTWVMKQELTCATKVVMTLLGNEMFAKMGNKMRAYMRHLCGDDTLGYLLQFPDYSIPSTVS